MALSPERGYFIDTNDTPASILRRAARNAERLSANHQEYADTYPMGPEAKAIQVDLSVKYRELAKVMDEAAATFGGP